MSTEKTITEATPQEKFDSALKSGDFETAARMLLDANRSHRLGAVSTTGDSAEQDRIRSFACEVLIYRSLFTSGYPCPTYRDHGLRPLLAAELNNMPESTLREIASPRERRATED